MNDDLSQEIHGNMIFSAYTCRRYKRGIMQFSENKSNMIFSHTSKTKGDWHSRLKF